jgi:hypothetical protein
MANILCGASNSNSTNIQQLSNDIDENQTLHGLNTNSSSNNSQNSVVRQGFLNLRNISAIRTSGQLKEIWNFREKRWEAFAPTEDIPGSRQANPPQL